jgi:formyl-CoA transferase
VARAFALLSADELSTKLAAADIAFARVSDMEALAEHPHLRRITVDTPGGPAAFPAPAARRDSDPRRYGAVPALGEHTERVRAEFMAARAAE